MTPFTLSGKRVFVFDDLFTSDFVDAMAIFMMRQNYEYRPSFDNEMSSALEPALLERLPGIHEVVAAIMDRYHSEMTAVPVDQILTHGYAAAIRFGDSCSLHQDIVCDDCVSVLYYANVSWEAAWGGETVFYEDDLVSAVCVSPRPGRLVLFNAGLHHRAGVPTKACPTFRYALSLFYRCQRMQPSQVSPAVAGEP